MANIDTMNFVMELKRYMDVLPKQTTKTLKGQALSGDLEGAKKGLGTVLRRRVDRSEKPSEKRKRSLKHDGNLTILIGRNRKELNWKNREMLW